MLSSLVVAFLSRSKCLLISWLQSTSVVILEPKKIKSVTVSIVSLLFCHEVMEPDPMILVFWMWSFKQAFSLSLSSSRGSLVLLCCAYLRFFIFLPEILIQACASPNPAFHMMYSAYKLNRQGDNTHPGCTPSPTLNQSIIPCLILTMASGPAYRFLKRQVRWSGIPISFRIFHSLLWSIQSTALA